MVSQKTKSGLKLTAKLLLSGLAIYLVFRKIELEAVWEVIKFSNPFWLLAAALVFNISQGCTSFRLLVLFKKLDLQISALYNLKLYYVGMFYNLFLPGGIGGDGYKVFHLKNRSEARARHLISAVFLDRLSGAATIAFLALVLALFAPVLFAELPTYANAFCLVLAILVFPVLVTIIYSFFRKFKSASLHIILWSLAVQVLQITCAFFILKAYGVQANFTLYFVLFLVSSIAATLPISFGGVGLRELVFLYASKLLPIDGTAAVALALMFFIITALSSFVGVFVKLPSKEKPEIL